MSSDKKSPFVPSGKWREAVEALYVAHFAAAGVTVKEVTIHADSSATVNVDAENCVKLMGHRDTLAVSAYTAKRNLRIVIPAAMQFLSENDPFASRGQAAAPSRKLSDEERAERERQAELRRRLTNMLNRYKATGEEDDADDD